MPHTHSYLAFDTLGYMKLLMSYGMSRERAETLAVASRECVAGRLAMEDLAKTTVDIMRQEPEALDALTRHYMKDRGEKMNDGV